MLPSRPPRVLILTGNLPLARHWADWLAEMSARVWIGLDLLSKRNSADADEIDGEVDIVITDGSVQSTSTPNDRHPGTIGMGLAEGVDVSLPPDCTRQELTLAVRLLGEIVELRRQRDQLERGKAEVQALAETDPLTGLPNRRAWQRQLDAVWSATRKDCRNTWLAIVDLDRFKQVNDRFGLATGDRVLRQTAETLAAQLRRHDVVARLGGDEFAILLREVAEAQVAAVLDRVREAVARQPRLVELPVEASIGYAGASLEHATVDAWLAAAERALRRAKQAGGNRVERG